MFSAMSTTIMETKTKKEKPNKKREPAEPSELTVITTSTAIPAPPPNNDPYITAGTKKKRKSPDSEGINSSRKDNLEGSPSKKCKALVEEIEVDISKPEPPSKKALRRLKKGKPLPPPKNGADTSPVPEEKNPEKPEAEKRSEHGVWIGNLPWSVTKADLRTFLTSHSDITDDIITRIHMPSPDDGKATKKAEESKPGRKQQNKGFAYVDFSVPEAVQQAIELSEQLLSGRRMLIKNSKSFEGRPQKTKEENRDHGKPPSKRVFVGNLRFDTTEESLREHFAKCGAIESVMVAQFEDSSKCKGYAWITFADLEAAKSAVRGYVLVNHDDRDTGPEPEPASDADEAPGDNRAAPRARPTRTPAVTKCFLDKIHRRPLRREFAEDAQARYKKRFGKRATDPGTRLGPTAQRDGPQGNAPMMDGDGDGDGERAERVRPLKQVKYRTSYAPRLTGGIVESKGKKVVF